MKVRCKVCGKVFDVDDSYNKTIYCPFCASNLHNPNYNADSAINHSAPQQTKRVEKVEQVLTNNTTPPVVSNNTSKKTTKTKEKTGFFGNPGAVIEIFGRILFIIGMPLVLFFVIVGFVEGIVDDLQLVYMLLAVVGVFFGSFSIIAYGRLVRNSDKIRKKLEEKDKN